MRFLIIGILLGFPALEGWVLYELASGPTGHGGWVLAWLAFSAIAGIVLIKEARFSLVNRLASAFAHGQFSLGAFIDSFRTVLAGLLLIPSREPAFQRATVHANRASPEHFHPGGVIEGEFRRES